MFCRLSKGILLGAVVGVAAGMAIFPHIDRRTQRSVKRAGKRLVCAAEDTYDNIASVMR